MAKPAPADTLGNLAMAQAERACVIESPSGRIFTWRQHMEQRNRLASALAKRGFGEGGRIVCFGHNSHEWILTRTVATIMSAYFVPMNWHLAAPEIAYIIDNCDAEILMIDAAFVPTLRQGQQMEPGLFKKLKHVIVWGGDGKGNGVGEPLDALLADGNPEFPQVKIAHSRSMTYTGGTSGKPKAVVSGRQLPGTGPPPTKEQIKRMQEQGQAFASMMGPAGLCIAHPNMVHIIIAPMYHAAPGGFMNLAVGMGQTMVVMHKFVARDFIALVDKYRVTNCVMPPIIIKRITDLPESFLRSHNISSLKSVTSVGAPCPMPIKEAALRIGIPLHEFYGSSELGINTLLQPADMLRKPGSCGRIAPGVRMKIFDDDEKEVPRGKQGLLYIKDIQLEYYNAAKKTQDARLKSDPSWSTVGDIAYIDDEDFVYICDRKIDMIISGGANIYPAEIEDCLFRHPAIADVAVFGTPDPDYGENVHAAVLLKEGQRATAADVKDFAKKHIAGFKVPKEISFHADFPRTPSGKILKRQLRDKHWKGRAKL